MLLSLIVWLGGLIFFPFVQPKHIFSICLQPASRGQLVGRVRWSALHWMGLVSGNYFPDQFIAVQPSNRGHGRMSSRAPHSYLPDARAHTRSRSSASSRAWIGCEPRSAKSTLSRQTIQRACSSTPARVVDASGELDVLSVWDWWSCYLAAAQLLGSWLVALQTAQRNSDHSQLVANLSLHHLFLNKSIS